MKDKKLNLLKHNGPNGIIIICANCGCEFEETCGGYYSPLEYESEKYNRECENCLRSGGAFS